MLIVSYTSQGDADPEVSSWLFRVGVQVGQLWG